MLLRELYEETQKTAVLAFGRLNPPTIGHAKLVDAIKSQDGDHYLFLSQSQKPKTDPLDFPTKIKFAKQFFPGINIGHQSVRTPVQALEMLQSLGYTDVIFIAGSDRVDGFQKLFDTYNGQPDKSGKVPFKFNSIKVASAGERDPDADDVSGMSASKMRALAAQGEFESFAQGVPNKKLAKSLYDAVRNGMGIKEPVEEQQLDEIAPAIGIAAVWLIRWAAKRALMPALKLLIRKIAKYAIGGTAVAVAIDQGWEWVKGQIGEQATQFLIDHGFDISLAVILIIGAVVIKKWVEKHGEKFAAKYAESLEQGDLSWMN